MKHSITKAEPDKTGNQQTSPKLRRTLHMHHGPDLARPAVRRASAAWPRCIMRCRAVIRNVWR